MIRTAVALGGLLDRGVRALHLLRGRLPAQVQHLDCFPAHGNRRMNVVPPYAPIASAMA